MKKSAIFIPIVVLAVVGCGSSPPPTKDTTHTEHAVDDHPSEGPHGGSLIELGTEEYHAEFVHDDAAKSVTIYILDSTAKVNEPIDAAEITINLQHEGRGEQFTLSASADSSDPVGKSSRFVSTDAELGEELDHEDAEPQLAVKIDDKSYRGTIEHKHVATHIHGVKEKH